MENKVITGIKLIKEVYPYSKIEINKNAFVNTLNSFPTTGKNIESLNHLESIYIITNNVDNEDGLIILEKSMFDEQDLLKPVFHQNKILNCIYKFIGKTPIYYESN